MRSNKEPIRKLEDNNGYLINNTYLLKQQVEVYGLNDNYITFKVVYIIALAGKYSYI